MYFNVLQILEYTKATKANYRQTRSIKQQQLQKQYTTDIATLLINK